MCARGLCWRGWGGGRSLFGAVMSSWLAGQGMEQVWRKGCPLAEHGTTESFSFMWGLTEDDSLGDSLLERSEELLSRGGEANIYEIWVKGYVQSSMHLCRTVCGSLHELWLCQFCLLRCPQPASGRGCRVEHSSHPHKLQSGAALHCSPRVLHLLENQVSRTTVWPQRRTEWIQVEISALSLRSHGTLDQLLKSPVPHPSCLYHTYIMSSLCGWSNVFKVHSKPSKVSDAIYWNALFYAWNLPVKITVLQDKKTDK